MFLRKLQTSLLITSGEPEVSGGGGAEPVVAPVVESAPVEPIIAPEEPVVAAPQEPAKPDQTAWKDREIAKLRAKVAELRTEKARGEIAPLTVGETQEAYEARLEARAQELASERVTKADWDRRMNNMVAEGRAKFTAQEFNTRIGVLRGMVDKDDPAEVQQYNMVLAAAEETGEGSALLHALGGDPSQFAELLATPALKMTVKLANMASAMKRPEALSETPKPIKPLGSNGLHLEGISPDDPVKGMRIPTAEWMAQRDEQAKKRGMQ